MKTDFKRDGSFCVILYFPKNETCTTGAHQFPVVHDEMTAAGLAAGEQGRYLTITFLLLPSAVFLMTRPFLGWASRWPPSE